MNQMQAPLSDHEIHQGQAKLKKLIESNLGNSAEEAYFSGFVKQVLVPDQPQLRKSLSVVLQDFFMKAIPKSLWSACIEYCIVWGLKEQNRERRILILDSLFTLVSGNVLPSTMVCDAILKHLDPQKEQVWRDGMAAIMTIIRNTDYVSCCMIWKYLLHRIDQFPEVTNESWFPVLNSVNEVVSFVVDRNNALIPAYSVYHEMRPRYFEGENRKKPHLCIATEVNKLHDSLIGTANVITMAGLPYMRCIIGVSNLSSKSWVINHEGREYIYYLKGSLPFSKSLTAKQEDLALHILSQPGSKECLQTLGYPSTARQNQPQPFLEELFVRLMLNAMETSEALDWSQPEHRRQVAMLWQQLAEELLYHHFNHTFNFKNVIQNLSKALLKVNCRKARDWLMWCCLQYVSPAWTKSEPNTLQVIIHDFFPLMNIYDCLYSDTEALPYPDLQDPHSVVQLAASIIWGFFFAKAENMRNMRPIPMALEGHFKLLDELQKKFVDGELSLKDFSVPVLCNASFMNADLGSRPPINILLESFCGPGVPVAEGGGGCVTQGPITPLSVDILNALCAYSKFSLINKVRRQIMAMTEAYPNDTSQGCMSPAMLETIGRFLVLPEIEWVAVKAILIQNLPPATRNAAWPILQGLLEVLSYRVHRHLITGNTLQLVQTLSSSTRTCPTMPNQLYVSLENVCLRLVLDVVSPNLLRYTHDVKLFQFAFDSEELNRVLVMSLAQAVKVTGCLPDNPPHGNWLEIVMRMVNSVTPLFWSQQALQLFPPSLIAYTQHGNQGNPADKKVRFIKRVEDEYRKWMSLPNEGELVRIFRETDASEVFLCVLFKHYLTTGIIKPIAFRILDRVSVHIMARQARFFSDFIVFDSLASKIEQVRSKLEDFVWKYQFISLDRLMLCLATRKYEGHDVQLCLVLMQQLMVMSTDLRNRIDAVKDMAIGFWNHDNWHQLHVNYHQRFPENFNLESLSQTPAGGARPPLPIYYSNVCLRFIPVLDVVVHRFLEFGAGAMPTLDGILEHLKSLYRFHDHPIMYVFTTMYYFEKNLADFPLIRKKLVFVIIGALQDIKPLQRFFLPEFCEYLHLTADSTWQPPPTYFLNVIHKITDAIGSFAPKSLGVCDWRFEEFHSPVVHTLYCLCIELMCLPQAGKVTGNTIVDIYLAKCSSFTVEQDKDMWTLANSLGLLFAQLPDSFRSAILEHVLSTARTLNTVGVDATTDWSLFQVQTGSCKPVLILSLAHACWHHFNIGSLVDFIRRLRNELLPVVQCEAQLVFVFKLFSPFIQRLSMEHPQSFTDIVGDFYRLLHAVDQKTPQLLHADLICDILYHVKYMYSIEVSKDEIERIVSKLHMPLRVKLRFMLPSGGTWHNRWNVQQQQQQQQALSPMQM
jgi:mediator of RNA polymerase II transcription subunit 23